MADRKNEEIAAFRFGVIHEFVSGAGLSPEEKRRLLLEKCERKWHIPHSPRTRISANTIYRWIRRYRDGGGKIQALYPLPRNDSGNSRKLDSVHPIIGGLEAPIYYTYGNRRFLL